MGVSIQPLKQRGVHFAGTFEGREVAALLYDSELRIGHVRGEFFVEFERSDPILATAKYEGGTSDGRQIRAAVGAAYDRPLLPLENLDPGGQSHLRDDGNESFVIEKIRVEKTRKQPARDFFEAALASEFEQFESRLRLLGRVGAGRSVEESETLDPFGSLAHHLKRDISAHRKPAQSESLRRAPENSTDHSTDGAILRDVGDQRFAHICETFDLGLPQPPVAQKPRHEDQRFRQDPTPSPALVRGLG